MMGDDAFGSATPPCGHLSPFEIKRLVTGTFDAQRKHVTDTFVLDCAEYVDDTLSAFTSQFRRLPKGASKVAVDLSSPIMDICGLAIPSPESWPVEHLRCVLRRPLDLQIIDRLTDSGEMLLQRTREITLREARGRIRTVALPLVEWQVLTTLPGARSASFIFQGGNGWRLLSSRESDPFYDNADVRYKAQLTTSMAIAMEYFWNVDMRAPQSSLALRVPMTANMALRMFKHRDKPEGRTRKAALRHLVSEHYRGHAELAEIEIFVRTHLRGVQSFSWFDMECTIRPSVHDEERIKDAIASRPLAESPRAKAAVSKG